VVGRFPRIVARRWRSSFLVVILALAMALAGCSNTPSAGTYTAPQISGQCRSVLVSVVDTTNGKIAGWLVTLKDEVHQRAVVLQSTGHVTTTVAPGRYDVLATNTHTAMPINVAPRTIDAVCGGFYAPGSGTPCTGADGNCRLGIEIQLLS